MTKKTILVAGGTGYIGSHTTVELIQAGYNVVVVDNLSNSEQSSLQGVEAILNQKIPFHKADCCDPVAMREVFKQHKIDAIIHFAAYKAVGESVSEPLKYYRNNLDSLMTIIDMMNEFGTANLVFSSSCTVYGQPDQLPVTEATPRQDATSPYGNTKQMSEDIIRDCAKANTKLNTIALRYFNPIGAHPSALIGELPKGVPANLVPFITQTAAGIRQCISVFGNDYDTPDGSAARDYIDVTDLAKAHVASVARLVENKQKTNYEVFNVGTGRGVTVLELIEAFQKVNNIKLNHTIVGRREGDIEKIWAETSYANQELNWKAVKTIEETLASAWAWEKHLRNIK